MRTKVLLLLLMLGLTLTTTTSCTMDDDYLSDDYSTEEKSVDGIDGIDDDPKPDEDE